MALLKMEGITKSFPGVVATSHVNLELSESEVLGLVGENGAGKSTLMKILSGFHHPDGGEIFVKDELVCITTPKKAIECGIGVVYQHFMLVPSFTVLENIILGSESRSYGMLDLVSPKEKISSLMEESHLVVDLHAKLETLPVGLQQRVEILKILYRGAKILVFDEPTAVLAPQEVDSLFQTLLRLKKAGNGIIFISHKLDEVLGICDRITVMRRGKVIDHLEKSKTSKEELATLMVGKPVFLDVKKPKRGHSATLFEVRGLTQKNKKGNQLHSVKDLSLQIAGGEIYGIAGVEGNGQSELIQMISGEAIPDAGEIILAGVSLKGKNVRERREIGMGYVPEDRRERGLLLPFSLEDNMVLGAHHVPPFVKMGQYRDFQAIKKHACTLIEKFDIRTSSEEVSAETLSGGNQQKLVIARELAGDPPFLLACHLTRGVDVGSMEFIYAKLMEARSAGKAILLISADLDEILSLSDRVGVMYKGRIIKEFSSEEIDKEQVGFCMMGGPYADNSL